MEINEEKAEKDTATAVQEVSNKFFKHVWLWWAIAGVVLGVALVWLRLELRDDSARIQTFDTAPFSADVETWLRDVSPRERTHIPYTSPEVFISPELAAPFRISEIKNIAAIERKYGFTFTKEELDKLEQHKFIIKNLLDTNLTPLTLRDYEREFVALYLKSRGSDDYRERSEADSIFFTADSVMHLFSILSVELLKETENRYFFALLKHITTQLYAQAEKEFHAARDTTSKEEWTYVRDFLVVPHTLLSTAKLPPSPDAYWNSGEDLSAYMQRIAAEDQSADSYESAAAFVATLGLGAKSETRVLRDLKKIFDAPPTATPEVLGPNFGKISPTINLSVPFSLFTPRGSYTSSSLRRQYFRAVQWYQQIPFLLASKDDTSLGLKLASLIQNQPDAKQKLKELNAFLARLVGPSDDLDVLDYEKALTELGDVAYDQKKLRAFLREVKPPSRIKGMPAEYAGVGLVTEEEVRDATRGMRFFSQKFIPDSYWMDKLTQGDEAPEVDGMELPGMASSLQVMTILGSQAGRNAMPLLDFYPNHKTPIDIMLERLTAEANEWGDEYWKSSQATGVLWTIKGLFEWYNTHRAQLPAFMQSPLWDTKNLMTGSSFWTESRHTNILYAKQSFAERGGGGDDVCDARSVPPPARGYVEPQPEVYARLVFIARTLQETYRASGMELTNLPKLESYIMLVEKMLDFSRQELANTRFTETISTNTRNLWDGSSCTEEVLVNPHESTWEQLRLGLPTLMRDALPTPVEGTDLPIKDRRAAVVADVHTAFGTQYLEEGTGVPRVIFVAVRDANGPRLAVGFTYSHYEFVSEVRLTDEEWQSKFYTHSNDYEITYRPISEWPTVPLWYQELLGVR